MIAVAKRLVLAQITKTVNMAPSLGIDEDSRQKGRFVIARAGYSKSLRTVNEPGDYKIGKGGPESAVGVAADGTSYVAYVRAEGDAAYLEWRSSTDNGQTWGTKLITAEDVELCKRVKTLGRFFFNPNALVYVSTRRVRKWGYMRMVSFHVSNTLKIHATGQASADFEPVR